MKKAPRDKNEQKRLESLRALRVLDTPPDKDFDEIVQIVSEVLQVPIVLISLVDENRQWFKASVGIDVKETERDLAFCSHTVLDNGPLIVKNSLEDERFFDNPLVLNDPKVIFYAGVPLETSTGYNIGTLCAIDSRPRELSEEQLRMLQSFSRIIINQLESKVKIKELGVFSKMMEKIHSLNNTKFLNKDELFLEYLKTGSQVLGLNFGIVSKVDGKIYKVKQAISPGNIIKKNSEFSLVETYCKEVIGLEKTIFHEHVGNNDKMLSHPVYINMKLESYIGTPIFAGNILYGTLNFSSQEIRRNNFSEDEIRFVEILAQTIGKKIELLESNEKQAVVLSELEQEKERSLDLIRLASDGVHILDTEGNVVECSDSFASLLGYNRREAKKLNVRDWDNKFPQEELVQIIDDLIKTPRKFTTVHKKKDGSLIDVEINARGVNINGENFLYASSRDISENIKKDNELQESLLQFRTLTELAPVGIFMTDFKGECTYVNQAWCLFSGLDSEKAMKQGWVEAILESERESVFKDWNQAAISNQDFQREIKFRNVKSGKVYHLYTKATPLRTKAGEVFGYIGINLDLGHQKKVEKELKRARDEAIKNSQAKSIFLSNMSHEIRTPLNSIVGLSDILSDLSLTSEQHDYVSTLKNSSELLLNIVNDILDLSKIEAGEMSLESKPFSFENMFEDLIDLFSHQVKEKRLSFDYFIEEDFHRCYVGDYVRIKQVLINLIGNALKFTVSGNITFSIEKNRNAKRRGNILVTVSDTGIGIAKERLKSIFKNFTQAESSTTRKFGGTGLGLSITKQLSILMKGDVWVESQEKKGSKFFVTFDLPEIEANIVGHRFTSLEEANIRAVVVDDNPINLKILENTLNLWGIEGQYVKTNQEATELLSSGQYNLLIVDYLLNGENGMDLLHKFKEEIKASKFKAICLSSLDDHKMIQQMAELGCPVIIRPSKKMVLYSKICELLKLEVRNSSESMHHIDSKAKLDTEYLKKINLNILLVDDTLTNRNLIKAYLKNFPYEIAEAVNGKEALKMMKKQRFDLVFMDMQMPEMDGYTATRKFREWELSNRSFKTPIIALSAYALIEEQNKSLQSGCNSYLCKPIKKETLLNTIYGHAYELINKKTA